MSYLTFRDHRTITTSGPGDIIDITAMIEEAVSSSGISEGQCLVFVGGSTAAITTTEYEPGLVADMRAALERIAPKDAVYKHNEAWHDGNGHSHVRASLIGPSLCLPVIDRSIPLGTWQQVVLMEMDVRPREREIIIQIIGVE